MDKLLLKIQMPDESFEHKGLDLITLPTAQGVIGVLPKHASMTIHLASGVAHLFRNGKSFLNYFTSPGIAHISDNTCLIISEQFRPLEDLDPVILNEKLEEYHDDLAGLDLEYEQRFIERQITIIRKMLRAIRKD